MNFRTILKFAWRYFKAKKSTNAINVISWVSVVAIIFGTASLIVILSAFNGFESLVKSLYASFYPDIKITAAKGQLITLTQKQLDELKGIRGIETFSLVAEEKALIQNGGLQTVVHMKGVDENYEGIAGIASHLYRGEYSLGNEDQPGLIFGVGVEQALALASDQAISPVSVYLPNKKITGTVDPLASLSLSLANPRGSFAIQSEFDNKYVITNLEFIRTYAGYQQDQYSAVEIKLSPNVNVEDQVETLETLLGKSYKVEDRFQQNRTLYNTIKLEKLAIYGIFSLILIVAAFNMLGALSMLVLEKKKDIQVLMAMGADQSLIQKIFLAEGILLSSLGTIGGMLIALMLYYLQVTYKLVPLQGETFLIDYYPVQLLYTDFLLVGVTVFTIGIIASWIPARKAAVDRMSLRN
ncbi:MAG: ABC transporter permease [Chitinophagaceae bacterium]|nr:ABC transporter permease [Chitinophagaceae bacterium]